MPEKGGEMLAREKPGPVFGKLTDWLKKEFF
jgi:hypothetical protein